MANLKGSVKQIEWANRILATRTEQVESNYRAVVAQGEGEVKRYAVGTKEHGYGVIRLQVAEILRTELLARIAAETSASSVIDNRNDSYSHLWSSRATAVFAETEAAAKNAVVTAAAETAPEVKPAADTAKTMTGLEAANKGKANVLATLDKLSETERAAMLIAVEAAYKAAVSVHGHVTLNKDNIPGFKSTWQRTLDYTYSKAMGFPRLG